MGTYWKFWIFSAALVFNVSSLLAEDNAFYEKRTGFQGSYNASEKVFRANFPRTDVKIIVDQITLNPFLGLTSWSGFTPINDQYMVMGDFVLIQDEVNPVLSLLLDHGMEVTALHNHFFYDSPRVFFMHIGGMGSLEFLSDGVKKVLEKIKIIRSQNKKMPIGFGKPLIGEKNSITAAKLEAVFGAEGLSKNGMFKITFGAKTKLNGIEIGKDMGNNTWAGFGGSDEVAFVGGDFAVREGEVQSVLKILRRGNINIVSIHNHMI